MEGPNLDFFFPPPIPPPSILGRGDLRRENHPRDLVLVLALRSSTHEIWCSRKKADSSPRDGEAGEEGRLKEEGRFFPTRCHAASNWYASICYATTKADASSCALNTAYASANQWLMVAGNRWWDPWGSIRFSKSMLTEAKNMKFGYYKMVAGNYCSCRSTFTSLSFHTCCKLRIELSLRLLSKFETVISDCYP
ncbi:unnamed protein product [Urochloa humidicola]